MARTCGACRQLLRWDETLSAFWLEHGPAGPGIYVCCPSCIAQAEQQPSPPQVTYPPGSRPYGPICGLCRVAMVDGNRHQPIRLEDEDISQLDLTESVEPGAYLCCAACVALWRPVVLARWQRLGLVAAGERGPRELL